MDASCLGEYKVANNRLVSRDADTRVGFDDATDVVDLRLVDSSFDLQVIVHDADDAGNRNVTRTLTHARVISAGMPLMHVRCDSDHHSIIAMLLKFGVFSFFCLNHALRVPVSLRASQCCGNRDVQTYSRVQAHEYLHTSPSSVSECGLGF